MAKTVVALYDRFEDAQSVVQDLLQSGFRRDDIGLMANEDQGQYDPATGTSSAGSAGGNAGLGAAVGGIAGLLVGLAALAIPGIGPVLAAGPLVGALAGAGVGAMAGGLIGVLMDAGVPEEQASYYAEGVRRGGTLVTVRTTDDLVERATGVLNRYHPVNLEERATEWRSTGWTGFDRAGQGGANPASPARAAQENNQALDTSYASDAGRSGNERGRGPEAEFRRDYQRAYAQAGYSFDEYQPAYQYGYDLGQRQDLRGSKWQDVEPQARRDWEHAHPNSEWTLFAEAVRYGWTSATGTAGGESAAPGPGTYQGTSGQGLERYPEAEREQPGQTWDPGMYGTRTDVERTQGASDSGTHSDQATGQHD